MPNRRETLPPANFPPCRILDRINFDYSDDFAQQLNLIFPTEASRQLLLAGRHTADNNQETADLLSTINRFTCLLPRKDVFFHHAGAYTTILAQSPLFDNNGKGHLLFLRAVETGLSVLDQPQLFQLFSSQEEQLARFLLSPAFVGRDKKGHPIPKLDSFEHLAGIITELEYFTANSSPLPQVKAALAVCRRLFQTNLTSASLLELNALILNIDRYEPKYFPAIAEYYTSAQDWPAHLRAAAQVFERADLANVTFEQLNEEMIYRYAQEIAAQKLCQNPSFTHKLPTRPSEARRFLAKLGREQPDHPLSLAFTDLAATYFSLYCRLSPNQLAPILTYERRRFRPHQLKRYRRQLSSETSYRQELEKAIAAARRYEHPLHPFNSLHLAVTNGPEIEFLPPYHPHTSPKPIKDLLRTLNVVDLKNGYGTATNQGEFHEISPGPFRHPDTCIHLIRLFLHAGLLDPYRFTGLSIHHNIGLPHPDYLHLLVWNQFLTGYAFDPHFNVQLKNYHWTYFSLFAKPGTVDDKRLQVRAFDFLTAEGFELNWRSWVHLGNALNAYQIAAKPERLNPNNPCDRYLSELAAVWNNHQFVLENILTQLGLTSFISPHIPPENAETEKFHQLFREVFPYYHSHYLNPHEVVTPHPITFDGQTWPNLVSFARDLTSRSTGAVIEIFTRCENEFIDRLRLVLQAPSPTQLELAHQLFIDYHTFPGKKPAPEKVVATLEELTDIFRDQL